MDQLVPVDVLAVGAHPDDIEIGCGGTILATRASGRSVGVVDLTRGELGTRGTAQERSREADLAREVLGLTFRTNLELPDGSVVMDSAARLRLIKAIRACRPQIVLTHPRFGHPDHHAASQLVEQAVHHSGLARIETGQPRHRPSRIAYWVDWFQPAQPDFVVDIGAVVDGKEESIRCYGSQLRDETRREPETYLTAPDFIERIRAFHSHLGSLGGCRFAEGFRLSRLPRIDDIATC